VIGLALAWLAALAWIAIGAGALAAPRTASAQFGIVLDDPRALAFIRAMGARDVLIGVFAALLLLGGAERRELLALAFAASAGVALLDLAVVSRDPAGRQAARWLHGGGAAGLLVTAGLIAAER
jgi:hypothetical protein